VNFVEQAFKTGCLRWSSAAPTVEGKIELIRARTVA